MRRRRNSCSCGTVCKTPSICFPVSPTRPIAPATVTLKDLLKLIETKCDQHTCDVAQIEMDLLYEMIQLEDGRITHLIDELGVIRTKEGEIVKDLNRIDKDLHTIVNHKGEIVDIYGNVIGIYGKDIISNKAFQLIENMVENLNGDLKEKYPSAELLKKELAELWNCIQDKQVHFGDWDKNFTLRDVVTKVGHNCDGKDTAPKTIKVQTPVNAGSTVYHMWKGKRCLFESLIDGNVTKPTEVTVLEGKWINYCELKEVIQCVFPKTLAVDCKDKCDGLIHYQPSLCERVTALDKCTICTVIDTSTVDLTKAKLPKGPGNSIKADVKISKANGNGITAKPDGIWSNHVTNFEMVKDPVTHKNNYILTMGDGTKFTAGCCHQTVAVTTDSHTFQAEDKPGGTHGNVSFIRKGSITVPAGTPRSLFQVNSSNAMYAHFGGGTESFGTATDVSEINAAFMGYYIQVNGKRVGRRAWSNDEDTIYKGDTSDHIAHMSEQLVLKGGDVLTMEVIYGDHLEQGFAPVGNFEFTANSAYIDLLQIREL